MLVSVILFSTLQFVFVNAFFLKNMPSDIRGTMIGAFYFFGNIGCTLFAMIGGIMFDKIGPSSPFTLIAICDLIVCILAIVLACLGYLKKS